MEFASFVTRCTRHCAAYFDAIRKAATQGRTVDSKGRPIAPMYPTIILVFETPTHFAAELVGSTSDLSDGLQVIQRKLPSLANYLGHFPVANNVKSALAFRSGGGSNYISSLALLCERNRSIYEDRYPELSQLHSVTIAPDEKMTEDYSFQALNIPSDFRDLWLRDVLTVNNWRGQVRARYFQSSWLTERNASSSELQRRLNYHHPIGGPGTRLLAPTGDGTKRLIVQAANFSALASVDKIGETTITKFLELNSEVILRSLGGVQLIPQPLLLWEEGNPDPLEISIQPDFLIVDKERKVHICEVKLPLLNRTNLTTGGHRRRRFISAVGEGVAQLGNYRDYFSQASHKRLIEKRYNVVVSEPRLILIVGSSENYTEQEVIEAQRMSQKFELVDYDTLRALFLARSGYVPGQPTPVPTEPAS